MYATTRPEISKYRLKRCYIAQIFFENVISIASLNFDLILVQSGIGSLIHKKMKGDWLIVT